MVQVNTSSECGPQKCVFFSILHDIYYLFPGELCRSKKVFFHTDAAQAVGKIPVNVDDMKIDLMSISGHKIYGPKGRQGDVITSFPDVWSTVQVYLS